MKILAYTKVLLLEARFHLPHVVGDGVVGHELSRLLCVEERGPIQERALETAHVHVEVTPLPMLAVETQAGKTVDDALDERVLHLLSVAVALDQGEQARGEAVLQRQKHVIVPLDQTHHVHLVHLLAVLCFALDPVTVQVLEYVVHLGHGHRVVVPALRVIHQQSVFLFPLGILQTSYRESPHTRECEFAISNGFMIGEGESVCSVVHVS
jgi:hypothetical protein